MSTITNGASYRCIWWWTRHFSDDKENVRTEIVATNGLVADNIHDLLCEMETLAEAARADNGRWENFMSIFDISPSPDKHPTEEQWDRMRQILEEERGLKGEVYFMIEQEKADGRVHRHLVELRIDLVTGKAIPDNWDAPKCHAASRRICDEFGWERVLSPYDKDREERPQRGPKRWESYRAMQSGLTLEDIAAEVKDLRERSERGQDFQAALDRRGYILARGDKLTAGEPTLMIIDIAGDEHSLARRLKVKTKELNEFMRDVDRAALPDIRQAQAMQQERKIASLEADRATVAKEIEWEEAVANAAIEKEKIEGRFIAPEDRAKEELPIGGREKGQGTTAEAAPKEKQVAPAPELGKTQAEIRLARVLSPGPQSFANALEDRGFILTRVTDDDIQRDLAKIREEWEERRRNPQSWMEHEGGYAALPPAFQESARRSFEEWEARKQAEQPRQQETKQFTADKYDQKEWAEALRQAPVTDKNEAEEKAQQKRLEDYVKFVQGKWAEGPKSQLERAAGGLAVVTPFGSVFTLGPRNTGLDREELPEYLKGIDRAPLLSVTDAQGVMEDLREHRRAEWQHQHEEWLSRQPIGATAAGIRLAYSLTRTGPEFAAALEDRGLILACMNEADAERLNRWERQRLREERALQPPEKEGKPRKQRDIETYNKYQAGELVVINQYGSVFQLTAATTGAHAAKREERLKDIDRAPLLDVTAAQTAMQHYQQHQRKEWLEERRHQHEEWLMQQPLGATAAGIRLAYGLTQTGPQFAAALEDRGLVLACTTEADAERLNRWERQRLREERALQAPETETEGPRKERDIESYNKYQAGELVIVNQYGSVFQLTAATTGAHAAEREARLKEINRTPLMDVTAAQAAMQQYQQHERQEWRQQHADNYRQTLNEKVSPVSPPQPERRSAGLFGQAGNEAVADHRLEDLRGPAAKLWEQHRRAGNEHYFSDEHEAALRRSIETGDPLRHSVKTKGDREAFAAALDEHGISFARTSKEESYASHRQAAFAREIGNYAPRFKEGEIVIVTEPRLEYRKDGEPTEGRRVYKIDPSIARKFLETLGTSADKLQSIDATLKASDERAQRRRDERAESRLEQATDSSDSPWTLAGKAARMMETGAKTAAKIMDTAPRAVTAALYIGTEVSGMVFSLLALIDGPKSPRQQARDNWEGEKATAERNVEGEERIDFAKYAGEHAQEQRNAQEEQAARDRQRENERQR